jgi:hypothetical protein
LPILNFYALTNNSFSHSWQKSLFYSRQGTRKRKEVFGTSSLFTDFFWRVSKLPGGPASSSVFFYRPPNKNGHCAPLFFSRRQKRLFKMMKNSGVFCLLMEQCCGMLSPYSLPPFTAQRGGKKPSRPCRGSSLIKKLLRCLLLWPLEKSFANLNIFCQFPSY